MPVSIRLRYILVAVAVFFGSFLTFISASRVLAAGTSKVTSNEHLITVHDRGKDVGFLTHQTTLKAAFAEQQLTVGKNDLVEPGLDEQLVAPSYQVNVYRARPVIVVDGTATTKVMSPYQTSRQIAEHAGLQLHDEDTTSVELINDIVSYGAGLKVTVDRATPFTLTLYGKKTQAYTQATSVGDMLIEKQIDLQAKDKLSVAKETPIKPGMKVEIWRDGKQTITREEKIAFEVEQIQDTDRPIGYRKVTTPGVKGEKTVTYEVVMKNGRIIKKKKIQSVVLKQAKNQVEIVGTKMSLPPGSHEDWMAKGGVPSGAYGYANAIFSQESGWNPAARNPAGYVGLGQTSESNLSNACPGWQSDPICQIRFFDGYAVSRYGSWQGAYVFKFGSSGQPGHGWW